MTYGPTNIVRDQLTASVIQIEREKTMKGSSQSLPGCAPKSATSGSEPSAIWRGLSRAQRMYVRDGCIHGDCTMATVRVLRSKGLFELVIDSPNGQCGFMRLTPLGEAVRALHPSAADTSGENDLARDETK